MTNKWMIAMGLLLVGCPADDKPMLGTTGIAPMGTDGSDMDDDEPDDDEPGSNRPDDDEPDVDEDEDDEDDDEPDDDEPDVDDDELACSGDQFECWDGGCIPSHWACDGESDCLEGEDEDLLACPADGCDEDSFACEASDLCISEDWICDGDEDCPEGDDERDCEGGCAAGELVCADGTCLAATQVCDGVDDCPGGEDEMACGDAGNDDCGSGTVECLIGDQCIPASYQCDGEPDCPLGLDELLCPSDSRAYFECFDGELIPLEYVCDGYFVDCSGGEDEYGCGL